MVYVQRVIGKPGDTIKIEDNKVFLNGVLQKKTPLVPNPFRAPDFPSSIDSPSVDPDASVFEETIGDRTHKIMENSIGMRLQSRRFFPCVGM